MKMTMKNLFTLTVLLLFSSTLTSCSSDDDGEQAKPDPVAERMTLLTNNSSKSWLLTAQTDGGEDITSECQLDDVWTLKSNGTSEFEINEKCYEGQDDGSSIIAWNFIDNASSISTQDGDFFILELTETTLILELEYEDDGKVYKTQLFFKAK